MASGGRTTRLIARARYDWKVHALIRMGVELVLEPAHVVMERRILKGIKELAEQTSQGARDQLNSKAEG